MIVKNNFWFLFFTSSCSRETGLLLSIAAEEALFTFELADGF